MYVDHVTGFELIAARYQIKGQVCSSYWNSLHPACMLPIASYIHSWPDSYAEGLPMILKSRMLSKKSNKKSMQIILEILKSKILQDQTTNCICFWFPTFCLCAINDHRCATSKASVSPSLHRTWEWQMNCLILSQSLRSSVNQGGYLRDVKVRVGMKAEMKTAELSAEVKKWLKA